MWKCYMPSTQQVDNDNQVADKHHSFLNRSSSTFFLGGVGPNLVVLRKPCGIPGSNPGWTSQLPYPMCYLLAPLPPRYVHFDVWGGACLKGTGENLSECEWFVYSQVISSPKAVAITLPKFPLYRLFTTYLNIEGQMQLTKPAQIWITAVHSWKIS